jgi:NTP pyrophosphatase (non-canonical NTP hydrolase)
MFNKLKFICENLDQKYPEGKDPFKIITRLTEECGELASQVNHFENT